MHNYYVLIRNNRKPLEAFIVNSERLNEQTHESSVALCTSINWPAVAAQRCAYAAVPLTKDWPLRRTAVQAQMLPPSVSHGARRDLVVTED